MAKEQSSFERDYPQLDKMNAGELASLYKRLARATVGTHMGLGREEMADESWAETRVKPVRVWAPMATDQHMDLLNVGLVLC